MATQTWLGNAAAVTQVTTLTPTSPSAGDTFTVTCNSKSVSYTTTPGTVADVCNGLATSLANCPYAEFKEFTPQNTGTTITLTGGRAGYPFAVSVSVTTSGSATFSQTATVVCTGPNFWDNPANWSTGSVPVSGDDVYFSIGAVPCLYNLAQPSITLDSLNVYQSYTATIGLPRYNANGYAEYRTLELTISATTINAGQFSGQGAGRIRLNVGSGACTLNVYNTGQSADVGIPTLTWRGTSASNVVNVNKGSVGLAYFPGNSATIATLRTGYVTNVSGDVQLSCGAGCSITTIEADGGTISLNSAVTTITVNAGTVSVWGSGGVTTLNDYGTVYWNSTGTLGTLNLYGTFDTSQDQQAKTITNTVQMFDGATLNDPYKVISSLPVKVNCANNDVTLNLGQNLTLSRS